MLLSQKLSYEKNSFERIELFLSNQVFCYIFNVAINSVVCFPMLRKESLRSPTERLYFFNCLTRILKPCIKMHLREGSAPIGAKIYTNANLLSQFTVGRTVNFSYY